MNRILEVLLDSQEDGFGFFEQVFLFGSSLCVEVSNDIDILLVYESTSLEEVNLEKSRVEQGLADKFSDSILDITTLSKSELRQTDFLAKVSHRKIKG